MLFVFVDAKRLQFGASEEEQQYIQGRQKDVTKRGGGFHQQEDD